MSNLETIDGEYNLAMDSVGKAVSAASYGTLLESVEHHTHNDVIFSGGLWWLFMVATDLERDGDHLEAQWLDMCAYGRSRGAFESSWTGITRPYRHIWAVLRSGGRSVGSSD